MKRECVWVCVRKKRIYWSLKVQYDMRPTVVFGSRVWCICEIISEAVNKKMKLKSEKWTTFRNVQFQIDQIVWFSFYGWCTRETTAPNFDLVNIPLKWILNIKVSTRGTLLKHKQPKYKINDQELSEFETKKAISDHKWEWWWNPVWRITWRLPRTRIPPAGRVWPIVFGRVTFIHCQPSMKNCNSPVNELQVNA